MATLNAQRGSRARFLPFRVRAPVSNQNAPSSHRAPIPVTWGLPSGLIVVNQVNNAPMASTTACAGFAFATCHDGACPSAVVVTDEEASP